MSIHITSETSYADLKSGVRDFDASLDVDTVGNTLTFESPHHLNDGDQVIYHQLGADNIGLANGVSYYVIVVDDETIQLSASPGGAALILTSATTSQTHSFSKNSTLVEFDCSNCFVDDNLDTIRFESAHNFVAAEAVVYKNPDGSISGLDDSRTYYVIVEDDQTIRLADSREQAQALEAIDIKTTVSALPGSETTDNLYFAGLEAVDDLADTLVFEFDHHLDTGDEVTYYNAGTENISGLENSTSYYVIYVDDTTIRLAETADDAANGLYAALAPLVEEDIHSLRRTRTLDFDPVADVDETTDTVTLSGPHHLETGASVVYHGEGNWRLKGLTDGQTYYVVALDDTTIQLFKTAAETKNDNPAPIDLMYDDSVAGSTMALESATGNISSRAVNSGWTGNLTVGAQFASSFALGGSVGVNTIVNTTNSSMTGATVYATKDIDINTDDVSVIGAFAGNVQKGNGIGAAVTVTTLVDTVSSHITGSTVTAGRNLTLDGDMVAVVVNLAIGGSYAETFTAAGSIAVATMVDTVETYINNSMVTAGHDISLSADNTSVLVGAAGTGQYSNGGAVGAAVVVNTLVDKVSTRIEANSTVIAGRDVLLNAEKTTVLVAVALSGSFAQTFAGGGSVAVSTLVNTTEAFIDNSTVTAQTGDIQLSATDLSVVGSVVGSIAGSLGFSVGGAVAVNTIDNEILAYSNNGHLTAGNDISLFSKNLTVLGNVTFSGTGGKYLAVGGAVAVNTVTTNTESYVSGNGPLNSTLISGNDVFLDADDQSVVVAVGAAISVSFSEAAFGLAVGASVGVNTIHNTTRSYIFGSDVESGNLIDLDAQSSSLIVAVSIAAAVGVVTGGGGVVGAPVRDRCP